MEQTTRKKADVGGILWSSGKTHGLWAQSCQGSHVRKFSQPVGLEDFETLVVYIIGKNIKMVENVYNLGC